MGHTDTRSTRGERVNQLAESLFRRGLAMTMSSARQLAESMVETENRVQTKYQEHSRAASESVLSGSWGKKDVPFTSKGFVAAVTPTPEEKARSENAAEMRDKALHGGHVTVPDRFETPAENKFAKVTKAKPAAERLSTDLGSVYLSDDEYPELKGMRVHQAVKTPEQMREPVPLAQGFPAPAAEHEPASVTPRASPLSDDDFIELITDEKPSDEIRGEHMDEFVELSAIASHADEPGDQEIIDEEAPAEQGHAVVEQLPTSVVEETVASPEPIPYTPLRIVEDTSVVESTPVTVDGMTSVVPENPSEPPREDLAKKHGVDLFSIFGKR